jgi:acyl carrier protein
VRELLETRPGNVVWSAAGGLGGGRFPSAAETAASSNNQGRAGPRRVLRAIGPTMEIADEIKSVISKSLKIPVNQLTNEAKLEELGAASIDIIEIIFELEEKFNVDISKLAGKDGSGGKKDEDGLNQVALMTIDDMARAVQTLVNAKRA